MPAKLPTHCYTRNRVIWGRIIIAGREHRRSLRTTDPREAARRIKAWKLKLERQEFADVDAPSFKAAVVKWAKEVLPGAVKASVAKRYLVSIGQMADHFGALRIPEINAGVIGGYISARSGTATNATIRRDLTALSRLMSSCVAWGWVDSNPVRLFDRSIIRERRDPIQPPDQASFERILSAVPAPMAHILRLLDQTGMRENEAVTLSTSNVDKKIRQRITLLRTKTNRPRTLEWKTPAGDAGPILMLGQEQGPLLPVSERSAIREFPVCLGAVMRRTLAAEKKAKRPFRRFRVHDLRHGFTNRWLQNGGGIYQLSKHLGHTSVRTTEIYLSFLTAQEQDMAQSVAQGVVDKSSVAA